MNREIKFRAWNGKQMLDWEWIVDMGMVSNVICHGKDLRQVMQYTGLKDKNGKEIYEGDILKKTRIATDGNPPKQRIVGHIKKVIFHECAFKLNTALASKKYHLTSSMVWYYGLEVVGNIYESPQLLIRDKNDKRSVASKAK